MDDDCQVSHPLVNLWCWRTTEDHDEHTHIFRGAKYFCSGKKADYDQEEVDPPEIVR